ATRRVLTTGEPLSFEQAHSDSDEHPFLASVSIFPTRDASGAINGVGGIGRDVTRLRRVEREQALLASIVNASEDAIIATTTDLKIISWNRGAEKLYGYTADQTIGRGIDCFTPAEAMEHSLAACNQVMATGQSVAFEFGGINARGQEF